MTGILGAVLGSLSASKPSTPNLNSATNVGTNRAFNDGAISVSFSSPQGSAFADSYTVIASASGQTSKSVSGSSSPLVVTGLTSGILYSVTITASNISGTSDPSAPTEVTATTVPARINAPTVTSSASQDTVSWSAPSSGGSPITTYRWTSSDAKTGTTTNTSVVVNQEANTSQTYQVRAENLNGSGIYSLDSNSITTPPFFPPFFPPYFPYFPFFCNPNVIYYVPSCGICPPPGINYGCGSWMYNDCGQFLGCDY